MGMHEAMTEAAMLTMERYPHDWAKIMKSVRERLRDDVEFANDLRAFSMVPEHVGERQIEWYYAIQCHTKVLAGDIGACKVHIGAQPTTDRAMEENDAALQSVIRAPWYARAIRGGDDDGHFGWKAPVRATRFALVKKQYRAFDIDIEPWSAPLEVGYTHGYRSFVHLHLETALARWCYGDDFIRVFRMLPHAIEQLHKNEADIFSHPKGVATVDMIRDAIEQLPLWN
jgi:hypothetical protein